MDLSLTCGFWAHMSLPPKWHLGQFICFNRAHLCAQQIHRQTMVYAVCVALCHVCAVHVMSHNNDLNAICACNDGFH